ncbi:MAG: GNAT family N-acetyltransferase [Candidatus Eremiobacteraeota bacterium]|nr:GNAT family N-acetyltransferase [Candidatus Eremiobacteraeota bacterium]
MIIEPLEKDKHHRLAFTCGKEPLDRFIHEHAHQAAAKGLSQTYVALDETDETVILGYYTLTTCRIEAGELPDTIVRKLKLPKHELPASLVARLAVSESIKGQRVGSLMLVDAMARCARVAAEIGGVAIVVDALEESVTAFYERVGFTRFEPGSLKMFIPMETVRMLLGLPKEHRQAG